MCQLLRLQVHGLFVEMEYVPKIWVLRVGVVLGP